MTTWGQAPCHDVEVAPAAGRRATYSTTAAPYILSHSACTSDRSGRALAVRVQMSSIQLSRSSAETQLMVITCRNQGKRRVYVSHNEGGVAAKGLVTRIPTLGIRPSLGIPPQNAHAGIPHLLLAQVDDVEGKAARLGRVGRRRVHHHQHVDHDHALEVDRALAALHDHREERS